MAGAQIPNFRTTPPMAGETNLCGGGARCFPYMIVWKNVAA